MILNQQVLSTHHAIRCYRSYAVNEVEVNKERG